MSDIDAIAKLLTAARELVFQDELRRETYDLLDKARKIAARGLSPSPLESTTCSDCSWRLAAERLRAQVNSLEGEIESLKGDVAVMLHDRETDRERLTDILAMETGVMRPHLVMLRDSMPKAKG